MKENRIIEYCNAEFENIERIVAETENLLSQRQEALTIIETSAIGAFLHSFYNGIENVIRRLLKYSNIPTNRGNSWHKNLLENALRNSVISQDLYDNLYDYLMFRHKFIHSYVFILEWDKLRPLAVNMKNTYEDFKKAILKYIGDSS